MLLQTANVVFYLEENMQNAIELIKNLYDSGILTAVALFGIRFFVAHTKNKNLQNVGEWAQDIAAGLDSATMANQQKRDEAIRQLTARIARNKLTKKFTPADIAAAIEHAVLELHKGAK